MASEDVVGIGLAVANGAEIAFLHPDMSVVETQHIDRRQPGIKRHLAGGIDSERGARIALSKEAA